MAAKNKFSLFKCNDLKAAYDETTSILLLDNQIGIITVFVCNIPSSSLSSVGGFPLLAE